MIDYITTIKHDIPRGLLKQRRFSWFLQNPKPKFTLSISRLNNLSFSLCICICITLFQPKTLTLLYLTANLFEIFCKFYLSSIISFDNKMEFITPDL